ncbi:esterase/lipase family protein [Corynebacterium pacaense]|uniref:esterase/lipase family protein n=1 Tax=Corynebacterium pacaense TaxID=1816684 RepID=UPI0015C4D1CE|nr:alpha/beta fold hydrolase [Corynebacterium pacaense]
MSWISWIPPLLENPKPQTLAGEPRIVVMLHGTGSEPGVFRHLAHALNGYGVPALALTYGRRATRDLDECLRELEQRLLPLMEGGRRIDIVGHSLGGLMALRLARVLPPGSITTIVGLGAAWRGTPWTRHRLLRRHILGESFVQVQTRTPFPDDIPPDVEIVSIVSDADSVVPAWSSRLGRVIEVHGVRHNALPRRIPEILRALGLVSGSPVRPGPVQS